MKQIRPIEQAFRVASGLCKLANEWRDTATYTLGGAWFIAQAMQGDHQAPLYALLAVAGREGLRSLAWERTNAFAVAGGPASRIDPVLFSNTAGMIFAGCGFLFYMTSPDVPVGVLGYVGEGLTGAFGFFAYRFYQRGGVERGLRGVYFGPSGMWDWPRKCGGNGPTQTVKLKQSFKRGANRLGRRLGGLVPQPSLAPARRISQSARHTR